MKVASLACLVVLASIAVAVMANTTSTKKHHAKGFVSVAPSRGSARKNAKGHVSIGPMKQSEIRGISFEEHQRMRMQTEKRQVVQSFASNSQIVDWTTTKAIGPVLDQGNCGCCWTFSATGALSAAYYIKYGQFLDFSQEQLIDCDVTGCNTGCGGGNFALAFEYWSTNGAATNQQYPFLMWSWQDNQNPINTCYYNNTMAKAYTNAATPFVSLNALSCNTHSCSYLPSNATAVLQALTLQPVSVTIDADGYNTQNVEFSDWYPRGCNTANPPIFTFAKFNISNPNHAVLAVGYDLNQGTILIKNSWSTDWGCNGYANVSINPWFISEAQYPIVA
jgi:C1A family cysteine protease